MLTGNVRFGRIWVIRTDTAVFLNEYAAVAQSVERVLGKDEVTSSNLVSS